MKLSKSILMLAALFAAAQVAAGLSTEEAAKRAARNSLPMVDTNPKRQRGNDADRTSLALRVSVGNLGLAARLDSPVAGAGDQVAEAKSDRATDGPMAAGFRDPPFSARPAIYWAWLNGYVNLPQLSRELAEMKDKGISKAYIFECGARDPQRIVPAGPAFMSPESVDTIAHAVREAGRLGIELGLTTSSSWNAGGSWVAPKDASMGLYHASLHVTGPRAFRDVLPFPAASDRAPKGPDGRPAYYKDVAVLAWPRSEKTINDRNAVVDLTSRTDKQGRLTWDVPPGDWTVVRFVCANTGQGLAIPSPNSQGLAIDHFSSDATRMHFQYFIDKLQPVLGELRKTSLSTLYLCSYELRGAVWTPNFLDEFRKRRGYDMTPFLPALAGFVVESPEITERFQYDYRKTQGDLLVDAFYKTAAEMCHRHGLLLCAEAGGPGPPTHNVPVDALKAQGAIDIPRGEFWTDEHLWVVKETACAAHIYGKKIVDMEAFTGWSHWQHGPLELKPLADRAFCDGANHFTFHTSPHNPPDAGKPGWVYHAGTHISPSEVWWPMARPFFDYLARCSYLLQQGVFVADVCYYYGDQAFNFVPPKPLDPRLGFGYDYDVTNADVLLTHMQVRDGRLALPGGTGYELLVLPERDDIDWDVLQKLEKLVNGGATVVGPKPTRSGGLAGLPERDRQVRALAERLWGPCDGQTVKERRYGKGKVVWGRSLRELLIESDIGPDFTFTGQDEQTSLDYLHRRTDDADIYFVRNKSQRTEPVECTFRVVGKRPELWMPDTGEIHKQPIYRPVASGTQVPLRLPPSGSLFVVFRDKADADPFVSLRLTRSCGAGVPPANSLPTFAGGTPAPHLTSASSQRSSATATDLPPAELLLAEHDRVELLAWRAGSYEIKTSGGKSLKVEVPSLPAPQEITGPWEVRFPENWGAPASAVFPKLHSWTEHSEPGIKYFSGIATYAKEFDLPAELFKSGSRLFLDLGSLRFVADVSLNGRPLGVLWKPPYRLDITESAASGKNRLVVRVGNTWSNRLVGDVHSPDGPKYCRTNMLNSQTWRVPWKDTPLLESGLLGPVRVVAARSVLVMTSP